MITQLLVYGEVAREGPYIGSLPQPTEPAGRGEILDYQFKRNVA
jgi:hypothetical protein